MPECETETARVGFDFALRSAMDLDLSRMQRPDPRDLVAQREYEDREFEEKLLRADDGLRISNAASALPDDVRTPKRLAACAMALPRGRRMWKEPRRHTPMALA